MLLPARVGAGDAALESRERLPRPPGGAAAAATGCPARLPMCRAGLSHSRWRGRAPPAAGELLGEETRQIVSPIFAVEFWSLRALGCVARTPLGAPARAARALVGQSKVNPAGFRLRILESKIAAAISPRRRGDSLADAVQGKEQPPGCPGTALPKAAHRDSVSPAHPPPTARRRRARSDARGGARGRRARLSSHGLLLLAQERGW